MTNPMQAISAELNLDPNIFQNPTCFIAAVRTGIPGSVIRLAVNYFECPELIAKTLGTDLNGLEKDCAARVLNTQKSEALLDGFRTLSAVRMAWSSCELADRWLMSEVPALGGEKPLDLFDCFEGRRWVTEVAKKIERGDFS